MLTPVQVQIEDLLPTWPVLVSGVKGPVGGRTDPVCCQREQRNLSANSPASEAFSAKCCPTMDTTSHKKLSGGPITDCCSGLSLCPTKRLRPGSWLCLSNC